MPTNNEHRDDPFLPEDGVRRARAEDAVWSILGTFYRWRRFVLVTTGAVAVAAVVISLMLPNWYAASARLLAPESGSGGSLAAAMLKNLPSAAASFLGGPSGDFARYLTILSSRRAYEAAVDSFDLVAVYETGESPSPRQAAVEILAANVSFPVDEEFEYLSVVAMDTDPQRAADLANFFVRRLNEINNELSSQNAAGFRRFVEARYRQAEAALDSVLDATQAFQQEYGVVDLPAQMTGFIEQVADLRAQAIEAEIRYETARAQYGPENAQVRGLAEAARIANRKYQDALAGQEKLLPVAQEHVPAVVRRYADLEREGMVQARILEVIRPMLEQARFDEERRFEAVQVVDPAVPPVRKAKPRRSIIVIAATLSAFLLALVFSLVYEWWGRNHAFFARRLREAAREPVRARSETVESS